MIILESLNVKINAAMEARVVYNPFCIIFEILEPQPVPRPSCSHKAKILQHSFCAKNLQLIPAWLIYIA